MTIDTLVKAAGAADVARVRRLLDNGVDPNTRGKDGSSALFVACLAASCAVARLLLERGAQVDARHTVFNTNRGHFERATALHAAIEVRCELLVKLLISHGADVNAADAEGFTPLHAAAALADATLALVLLEAGADPNVSAGLLSSTPLMEAARCGRWEVVSALLANGAHRSLRDARGLTARDWAVGVGHEPPTDL
jgi:ankyrin repeat protein